ncbi:hypothetical protein H6501_02865 [Candidatus Woesearchaeota archaeon]|nr:hypothetical protein [Candidatus Woesearchaeota archaeon]USN43590.1 MAG: hypothetical protein H6500_04310 [Candidatus Woesearchaeota archaeon]
MDSEKLLGTKPTNVSIYKYLIQLEIVDKKLINFNNISFWLILVLSLTLAILTMFYLVNQTHSTCQAEGCSVDYSNDFLISFILGIAFLIVLLVIDCKSNILLNFTNSKKNIPYTILALLIIIIIVIGFQINTKMQSSFSETSFSNLCNLNNPEIATKGYTDVKTSPICEEGYGKINVATNQEGNICCGKK